MTKSVKGEEFVEKGALSQHIAETQKLIELYDKWDERIKEVAKDNKIIIEQLKTTNVKDVERLGKAQKEVNTATRSGSKIAQEKAKLEERLSRLRSKEAKENERLKVQISERRRQLKAEAKDVQGITGEYAKQSRTLNNLRKDYKNLAAAGRANGKVARGMKSEIDKLDSSLKRIDKSVGQSQRNVGNYSSALDGLGGKFRSVGSLATQFGVALGGGAIVSGIFNMNKELAKAEQTARTLFNVSNAGATQLAQNATKIAKIYGEDVNEVLRTANTLQKEFGVSEQESLNLIEQGFEKGINVSGEMLQNVKEYSTQLRLAGLSAEETFSFLARAQEQGVFNDKGVDAIKEATLSLREMTVPAQEALQAIGLSSTKIQKEINDGTKTYFEVIQEISSKTKEFGEDSQQAGMILADIFKGAGEDAGQFIFQLDEMDVDFDNLESTVTPFQKSVNNLTESWYDYIFGINEAGGLSQKLAGIMSFVANNLSTIIGVIVRVVAYWGIYKIAMMAVNSAQNGFLKSVMSSIRSLPLMIKSLKTGTSGVRSFSLAMKSIPFVAVIAGISELVFWMSSQEQKAVDVANAEKKANDEMERGNQIRKERIEGQKTIDENYKQRNSLSQAQLKILKQQLENEIDTAEATDLSIKTAQERVENYKEESSVVKEINEVNEKKLKLEKQLEDASGSQRSALRSQISAFEAQLKSLNEINDEALRGLTIGEQDKELRKEGVRIYDDEVANLELREEQLREVNKLIKDTGGVYSVNNKEIERHNKYLKEQSEILKELTENRRKLFEQQIEATGDEESILRLDTDNELNEIEEFKREYIRQKKEIFGADAELNEQELEAFKDLRSDIEEELKRSLQEMEREKRLEMFKTDQELAELDLQILENQMNKELALVKGKDEEAVAARNKIRAKHMEERANLINEIAYMEIQALEEEIQMWEQSGEPIAKAKIEALRKQIELKKQETQAKGQAIAQEKEEVQAVDNLTESYGNFTQAFEEFSNMRQQKLDEEIRKIDEFIDASKKREQELSELRAKEGADVAESLAFEQQKQAEAQARKAELEKKKRRTELATAVVNLVSSKIEQGSTNPTGEAFQDIASIQAFIQTLPTFWGGTDTTIGDAVGMKYSNDRDGVIVRADPSEMILNKDKVDELRGMGINRTDDIVNVAKMWKQSGAIQYNNDYNVVRQTTPMFNSKVMERELKGLKSENEQIKGYLKSINEKPVQVFDVKKMGDYVDLISKKVEGNKTTRTYKRFR